MKLTTGLFLIAASVLAFFFFSQSGPDAAIERNERAKLAQGNIKFAVVWPTEELGQGYVNGIRLALEGINSIGGVGCPSSQWLPQKPQVSVFPTLEAVASNVSRADIVNAPSVSTPDLQNQKCKRRKLEFSFYPEVSNFDEDIRGKSLDLAKKVVADPDLLAVLGYANADSALPASIVYEEEGVTFMSSGVSNLSLTRHDFDYVFRNTPTEKDIADNIVEYLDYAGYQKVFVISERGEKNAGFVNFLQNYAEDTGLDIVTSLSFSRWQKDFLPLLSSLKQATDSVNLIEVLADMLATERQREQLGRLNYLMERGSDSEIREELLNANKGGRADFAQLLAKMNREQLNYYLRLDLSNVQTPAYYEGIHTPILAELSALSAEQLQERLQRLLQSYETTQGQMVETYTRLDKKLQSIPEGAALEKNQVQEKIADLKAEFKHMIRLISRVKRMINNDFSIIVLSGLAPKAEHMVTLARNMKINAPIVVGEKISTLLARAQANCQGDAECQRFGRMLTYLNHDVEQYYQHSEQFRAFSDRYKSEYGQLPDVWAVQGFVALHLLSRAMNESTTLEPAIISNTLRYLGLRPGSSDHKWFKTNGDYYNERIEMVEQKGGRFETIEEF